MRLNALYSVVLAGSLVSSAIASEPEGWPKGFRSQLDYPTGAIANADFVATWEDGTGYVATVDGAKVVLAGASLDAMYAGFDGGPTTGPYDLRSKSAGVELALDDGGGYYGYWRINECLGFEHMSVEAAESYAVSGFVFGSCSYIGLMPFAELFWVMSSFIKQMSTI